GGRYWLFLEDLGDGTLKHADNAGWRAAVRWLAAMHGTYLGREDELRALDCLGEHGRSYYVAIADQARENLRAAGAGPALERFDALMDRFGPAISDLAAQPRTLVHGDIFPRNIALQPGGRIRPFDWESAAIGLPVWDLVRLGHDVTLFATGDSRTSAALHAVYPHDYNHDETIWDWRFHELLHVASAFERAEEFDVIHSHVSHLGLPFTRLVGTPVVHTY